MLDSGARGSTTTFAQNKKGDVHLTWENEALLEVQESKGELELVYPSASIRAEPYVAVVDSVVDQHGTRDRGRGLSQKSCMIRRRRRSSPGTAIGPSTTTYSRRTRRHKEASPDLTLFPVTSFVKGWAEAQTKFFDDGAEFDRIYQTEK